MEIDFLNRNNYSTDWATVLFVLTFATIVVTRLTFARRFEDFVRLAVSNKYLSTYRDTNNLKVVLPLACFLFKWYRLVCLCITL